MLTLPAAEEKKSKYLDFKEAFMKEIEIFIQEQRIYSQIVVETKLKDGKNTNRKKLIINELLDGYFLKFLDKQL